MTEVSFTVGKLDASIALLLTADHHLIEFPTILLPDGIKPGSFVTIKANQDTAKEVSEKKKFEDLQDMILDLYGTHEPQAPVLKVKNITQTSAVLEWEPIELGSSQIKALTLYKNGLKLGRVPNPLVNKTTKLSGLQLNTEYEFKLRMETTAGVFFSDPLKITTHKMTDLSGITVCIGDIQAHEGITTEDIISSLHEMGAKPLQTEVAVDTTHFIATAGNGLQWKKALETNIPVVRPEWLRACAREKRIAGVRNFYLDCDPELLKDFKFVKKAVQEPVLDTVQGNEQETAGSPPNIEVTNHDDQPADEAPPPQEQSKVINVDAEESNQAETQNSETQAEQPELNEEITQEVSTEDVTISNSSNFPDEQNEDKELEQEEQIPEPTILTESQESETQGSETVKEEEFANENSSVVVNDEANDVNENQDFEDVELVNEEVTPVASEDTETQATQTVEEPVVEEQAESATEEDQTFSEESPVAAVVAEQSKMIDENETAEQDEDDEEEEEEEKEDTEKTVNDESTTNNSSTGSNKKKNKKKKKGGKK